MLRLLATLFLFLFLTACGTVEAPGPTPPGAERKALFIGIDGLRGDGIPAADTPNLDSLMDGGVWTLFASTQMEAQTVSGPGWTSMLTGVDADKHGIFANGGWESIDRSYPTLLGRAHDLGLPTASAVHWLPIQANIIETQVTDTIILGSDEDVADGMAELLRYENHDVHFLALDDVDHAGHFHGFSPEEPEYVAAVEVADELVGRLLSAIEERSSRTDESWVVVVTSDHGGVGTGHGGITADHRAIPFIVWGDPVTPGELQGAGEIPGELDVGFVSHMDVHPTIMDHLGHPAAASWGLDGYSRGLD